MKSFENKVIVVTGGAHGIGASIVSEFEKEGAKVAYIDIRENPCFVGDLSKKDVLEKFAQFVIEKYGHVDVLVNNALPLMKGMDECSYQLRAGRGCDGSFLPREAFRAAFRERCEHYKHFFESRPHESTAN